MKNKFFIKKSILSFLALVLIGGSFLGSWLTVEAATIPTGGTCTSGIYTGTCEMSCDPLQSDDPAAGCDFIGGDTCCYDETPPPAPLPAGDCDTDFGHTGVCIPLSTCFAPKLAFTELECNDSKICCVEALATPELPTPTPPPPDADPVPTSDPPPPPTPGAGGLVPCGGETDDPCGIEDFIQIIANFIEFLLVYIAIPLAACVFMYAGFLMMTAGGNTTKIAAGKDAFQFVLIGLIIAFAAWLIVQGLLTGLGIQADFNLLG